MAKLLEIATRTHVTAVQETHGAMGDADVFLRHHRAIYKFFSPCGNRGTGGILFVVNKDSFDVNAEFVFHPLVPGRIARLMVRSLSGTHIFWNVHNFWH